MNTYRLCDSPFKRWRAQCSFSLLKKLSAEIIVLLCKQKPYPVFQVFMPAQQLTSMVWTYNVASVGSYKTQPQLAATKRSLSWQLQNAASVGSYKTQPQLAAIKRSLSWQLQNVASVGSYKTQPQLAATKRSLSWQLQNAGHRSQVQDKLQGRLVQSWVKITQG